MQEVTLRLVQLFLAPCRNRTVMVENVSERLRRSAGQISATLHKVHGRRHCVQTIEMVWLIMMMMIS